MKYRFEFDGMLVYLDASTISEAIELFRLRFGELLLSHVISIYMV